MVFSLIYIYKIQHSNDWIIHIIKNMFIIGKPGKIIEVGDNEKFLTGIKKWKLYYIIL